MYPMTTGRFGTLTTIGLGLMLLAVGSAGTVAGLVEPVGCRVEVNPSNVDPCIPVPGTGDREILPDGPHVKRRDTGDGDDRWHVQAPYDWGWSYENGCGPNDDPDEDSGHMEVEAKDGCFQSDGLGGAVPGWVEGSYEVTWEFNVDQVYVDNPCDGDEEAEASVWGRIYDRTDRRYERRVHIQTWRDDVQQSDVWVYGKTTFNFEADHDYDVVFVTEAEADAGDCPSWWPVLSPHAHLDGYAASVAGDPA